MKKEERIEEIEKTIEELKLKNEEMPIIVEGKKDRKALRALGIRGEIIKLNIGNSISSFCENFGKKYKKAIILTDWDRKGGELCAFLKENFKTNSVRYDDRIRVKLSYLCAKDIKDVEGLKKFFEKLKKS